MSSSNDFVIEFGVLKRYKGTDANVTIPDNIKGIGDQAFSWCKSLQSVTIPDSVTGIGNAAFSWCKSLQSVTIPDSVTSIGNEAFCDCENLQSVKIPDNVIGIGNEVFKGCKSLADEDGFVIVNSVLWDYYGSASDVTIPDGITVVGEHAFSPKWGMDSFIKSVTLPDGVLRIEDGAFGRCYGLKKINFPNGLISIGEGAFYRCGLKGKITFPDSIQSIGKRAFLVCIGITDVILPESILRIEDEAFELGTIKNSSIPSNLTIIGKDTFYDCSNLNDGKLPNGLKTVGNGAFRETTISAFSISPDNKKFKTVNGILLSKNGKKLIAFPPKGDLSVCLIPESVEQIGGNAFSGIWQSGHVILRRDVRFSKSAFKDTSLFVTVYCAEDAAALDHPIFIGDIDDLPVKLKNDAVNGFLYAEEHEIEEIKPYRQSYLDHIRRNKKTYLKQTQDNQFLLRLMIEEKMIPEKEINPLIAVAEQNGDTALKAELLEYRQKNFAGRKHDEFSLSDDDPEINRRLKQQERRDQIKGQKGIKGLSFVSTGDFKNFGWTDEYTGAKDMSDLKSYIEERGGFYRSAVSGKTDYLICNNPKSATVKSKKAKELGVPVIDEKTFLQMANEADDK